MRPHFGETRSFFIVTRRHVDTPIYHSSLRRRVPGGGSSRVSSGNASTLRRDPEFFHRHTPARGHPHLSFVAETTGSGGRKFPREQWKCVHTSERPGVFSSSHA